MFFFDENGNALKTHTVTVSGFDSITGEFINTYNVRILAGTGIPGFSTLTVAPNVVAGVAACWDGEQWNQTVDLRGSTAYEKATGAAVTVTSLGPLDDNLINVAPATQFDKWDGGKWVTDASSQKLASIAANEEEKTRLYAIATQKIDLLQDALNLEMANENEVALLNEWKKYRVLIMRIDVAAPAWPDLPTT